MPASGPASGSTLGRLRFDRLPAASCHPDHLAALLPAGCPKSLRDRLQHARRLRVRLSALLAHRHGLEPVNTADLATPEGQFAQFEGEALHKAALQAGAIWHAHRVRKIILAEPRRRLLNGLGHGIYQNALGAVDLSPVLADDRDDTPDVSTLLRHIEHDGRTAIRAWCHHQTPALGKRLLLKLPLPEPIEVDRTSRTDRASRTGRIIVDHVVALLTANGDDAETRHG